MLTRALHAAPGVRPPHLICALDHLRVGEPFLFVWVLRNVLTSTRCKGAGDNCEFLTWVQCVVAKWILLSHYSAPGEHVGTSGCSGAGRRPSHTAILLEGTDEPSRSRDPVAVLFKAALQQYIAPVYARIQAVTDSQFLKLPLFHPSSTSASVLGQPALLPLYSKTAEARSRSRLGTSNRYRMSAYYDASCYTALSSSSSLETRTYGPNFDCSCVVVAWQVRYLRKEMRIRRVVLAGHSTGSQDIVSYLRHIGTSPDSEARIDGAILISGISDREAFVSVAVLS